MKTTCAALCALLAAPMASDSLTPLQRGPGLQPRESRIPTGNASLYAREIGRGQPLIVLHGGPNFDHRYLLPDLDRLADAFRLIYYDQRGRGQSAERVKAEGGNLGRDLSDR